MYLRCLIFKIIQMYRAYPLKQKLVNKVFKILGIYETNVDDYLKYLEKTITELLGYIDDERLTVSQQEVIRECAVALKGLRMITIEGEVNHHIVRKIVLENVNKLDQTTIK